MHSKFPALMVLRTKTDKHKNFRVKQVTIKLTKLQRLELFSVLTNTVKLL